MPFSIQINKNNAILSAVIEGYFDSRTAQKTTLAISESPDKKNPCLVGHGGPMKPKRHGDEPLSFIMSINWSEVKKNLERNRKFFEFLTVAVGFYKELEFGQLLVDT